MEHKDLKLIRTHKTDMWSELTKLTLRIYYCNVNVPIHRHVKESKHVSYSNCVNNQGVEMDPLSK